ncbi:MAG: hypothetical protein J5525_03600 [Lachnospiraceae bacterium]|nr:hypothetical protein [Lachnospiraceae bacterium]
MKKNVKATLIIFIITAFLEIFAFNFSTWRSMASDTVTLAENVATGEELTFYTEVFDINGPVKNVDVDLNVENHDLAYVSVILTDEGDKYEYGTPEYTVCNGIKRSGFSNIYSFDDVKTIQVKVRVDEGCTAHINSIKANAHIPMDIKPIRVMILFALLWLGYMICTHSFIHEMYLDEKKGWQKWVTAAFIIGFILIGSFVSKADKVLMNNPWPHHSQYQELARNLSEGRVYLEGQYVEPALMEAENPYDTIALQAEGIPYSMDYAFYNGHYYVYFGIVPEMLFYFPYYRIKGVDLPNHKVMFLLYLMLTAGVFLSISGLVKRYVGSLPYIFYLMICGCTLLTANFVYLTARSDIYNVPILSAVAFTFIGIGLWLAAINTEKNLLKRIYLAGGSFAMALVAGCRPQLLIISGIGIILFIFEDGFKNRKLFTKKSLIETLCFCLPYVIVAIPVCLYNYARFGNILDFGATYSLTTNDMNHRGFNMNRLLRSLYCYLFQQAVINTDYPFLEASRVDGNYMGRFLYEYTYGGILVANAMLYSLWMGLFTGLKKAGKPVRMIVIFLVICAVIIAGFDANCAGVLYRYTCDFAPAFILAASLMWMMYLDRSRHIVDYGIVSRFAYICFVIAIAYAFMTFISSASVVCLENDNRQLFYNIAGYFKF